MDRRIKLRPATMSDAAALFAWRTDRLTRAASRNSGELRYENHLKWLVKSLAMPGRRIYIASIGTDPVGTVRADTVDGMTELSWTIAPKYRGRGLGKQMVTTFISLSSGPVRAAIKAENTASRRIAQAAGFRCIRKTDGMLHFVYQMSH